MTVRIPANGRVNIGRNTLTTIRPALQTMSAVGGQIVQDLVISGISYRVHTFTSSGILTVTTGPTGSATIEYLLVGGGGGGGGHVNGQSGGGGAGGFLTGNYTIRTSGEYKIDIGSGGAQNANGANSRFYTPTMSPSEALLLAYGGGAGGAYVGVSGGSGGGGGAYVGYPATPYSAGSSLFSQGNPGGGSYAVQGAGGAGGGGGASSSGVPGNSTSNGGNARETFMRGIPEWFAAGGGGTNAYSNTYGAGGGSPTTYLGGRAASANYPNPINGIVNTGSGGGGAGYSPTAGQGSSGIAIFRYRLS